jgi:hypothetical protein
MPLGNSRALSFANRATSRFIEAGVTVSNALNSSGDGGSKLAARVGSVAM